MYIYKVMLPANIFTGRFFCFSTTPIYVLAQSEKGAQEIINSSKKAITSYLHTRKVMVSHDRYRYLIPHRVPPEKNVFFQKSYYVRENLSYCENKLILCPDNEFHHVSYCIRNGNIKITIGVSINDSD